MTSTRKVFISGIGAVLFLLAAVSVVSYGLIVVAIDIAEKASACQ